MLNYIEFDTTIENNNIVIPNYLKNLDNKKVKIRMQIVDNESKQKKSNKKILEQLSEIIKLNVFSGIEDSLEWQRKIRDEWE